MSRASGEKPKKLFLGERNPDLNLPLSLTNALSRAIYNELVYNLPIADKCAGFPYLVLHESDPRGIVSTFEFETEQYEVIVRRKGSPSLPQSKDALSLLGSCVEVGFEGADDESEGVAPETLKQVEDFLAELRAFAEREHRR